MRPALRSVRRPFESIVAKLREVTADDVTRVAQRILKRVRAALAIVGPSVDEKALRDVLGAAS